MLLDLLPQTQKMFGAYLSQHSLSGSYKISNEYYSAEEQFILPVGGAQVFFATLQEAAPTANNPGTPTWLYYGYFDCLISISASTTPISVQVQATVPNFQGTLFSQTWFYSQQVSFNGGININNVVRFSPSVPVMLSYFTINTNSGTGLTGQIDFKFHGYRLKSA